MFRKNEIALRNINDFTFDAEFDLDAVIPADAYLPDTKYDHYFAEMANYQGYPLILGGMSNVKLEMLVTTEVSIQWNEQTDYPYANTT